MKFSLDNKPPSIEEIETEKIRVKNLSRRSRGLFALGVIICAITMVACFFFGEGLIAAFSFIISGVFLAVLILSSVLEFGLFDPSHQLYQLDTIHEEYCSHALELCKKHPELDQYRRKVISFRHLVNAEYTMFNEFVRKIEDRQKELERKAIFNAFHENKEWQKLPSSRDEMVNWKSLI